MPVPGAWKSTICASAPNVTLGSTKAARPDTWTGTRPTTLQTTIAAIMTPSVPKGTQLLSVTTSIIWSSFSGDADAAHAFDAFVARLREERLVEDADAGADEALPAPARYEAPELVIYRDMKDLMALDPPMPILDEQSR